jgi:HEAT repeat protein
VPAEAKAAALEALSRSTGEAGQFLLRYANDEEPELRAAAAWALSAAEAPGSFGAELAAFLQTEKDPNVRRRLYQALQNQENCDWALVSRAVQEESGLEPRLAGFDLIASGCRTSAGPEVTQFFDRIALPELKELALNSESAENRLTAAMALRRAATGQALGALQEIAVSSRDSRVVAAAKATLAKNQNGPSSN